MKRQTVSTAEIAAFVEGIADRDTARRVLAAALTNPQVREQVEHLNTLDAGFEQMQESLEAGDAVGGADFEARAERLRESMLDVIPRIQDEAAQVHEQRRTLATILHEGKGGALVHVAAGTLNALRNQARESLRQALLLGRHALTLPSLAPATASAAAAPGMNVQRQSVIADGVRIEFQEVPGLPGRLRVVVDASALTEQKSGQKQANESGISAERLENSANVWQRAASASGVGYNVAYLTLEDGDRSLPDRHILVISLNAEGRGFTDYQVGGDGLRAIPAPRTRCALIGATLSRLEPEDNEDAGQEDFDEFEVGMSGGGTL